MFNKILSEGKMKEQYGKYHRFVRDHTIYLKFHDLMDNSIYEFLKLNPSITSLALEHQEINDDQIEKICQFVNKLPQITALNLEFNNISNIGVELLIANNNTISKLNLAGNFIDDDGAKRCALHSSFTMLNLSHNFITDDGIKAFQTNKTLTTLDLSANYDLTDCLQFLSHHPTLQELILDENIQIGRYPEFAAFWEETKLKSLSLSNICMQSSALNNFSKNTTIEVLNIQGNYCVPEIKADAITKHKVLKSINLSDCNWCTNSDELAKLILTSTTLTDISVRDNKLTNSFLKALSNSKECNFTVERLDISHNSFKTITIKKINLLALKELKAIGVGSITVPSSLVKLISTSTTTANNINIEPHITLREQEIWFDIFVKCMEPLPCNLSENQKFMLNISKGAKVNWKWKDLTDVEISLLCLFLQNHPDITDLNIEQQKKITKIGLNLLSGIKTLKVINIRKIPVDDDGIKILSKSNIQELYASDVPISQYSLTYILNFTSLVKLSLRGNVKISSYLAVIQNLPLSYLDLSCCQLEPKHMTSIAKMRPTELNLSYNEKLGDHLGLVNQNTCLKTLNIMVCNLTDKSVKTILKHPSIEVLLLEQNKIENTSLISIAENQVLRDLNLRYCQIGPVGAGYLGANKSLEVIDLGQYNRITNDGLQYLSNNKNIKRVSVSNNSIDDDGIKNFVYVEDKVVKEFSIKMLDISINRGITSVSGEYLAEIKTLTKLDVSRTNFGDEGIKALQQCENLLILLANNTLITDKNLSSLSIRLFTLGLSGNQITNEGVIKLSQHTNLKKLGLSNIKTMASKDTQIGVASDGTDEATALAKTNLDYIDLSGTDITDVTLLYFAQHTTIKRMLNVDESKVTKKGYIAACQNPLLNVEITSFYPPSTTAIAIKAIKKNSDPLLLCRLARQEDLRDPFISVPTLVNLCSYYLEKFVDLVREKSQWIDKQVFDNKIQIKVPLCYINQVGFKVFTFF